VLGSLLTPHFVYGCTAAAAFSAITAI